MPSRGDPSIEERLGIQFKYELGPDPGAPLFILVHGRAGNFDLMWTFRRCLPEGVHIFALQAPIPDPIGGYSWWDIADKAGNAAALKSAEARLKKFIEGIP